MSAHATKRAFTIPEFCERWNLSRNGVYGLIGRGELQSIKAGKRRLITIEQEEDFRKRKEAESA